MSGITLRGSQKIRLHEIGSRQLVVPTGAILRVPEGCEWFIVAMSVLPRHGYTPPDGASVRDVRRWGDVQIRLDDQRAYFRTAALTLMDRYWGRYNLNPNLSEVTSKLEHALHLIHTAPSIPELARAIEHGLEMTRAYLQVAAPQFPSPITVSGGKSFWIEHLDCADENGANSSSRRPPGALDVELLITTKRPVS